MPASSGPPNACFVESVSALMPRMDTGSEAASPTFPSFVLRRHPRRPHWARTVLPAGTSAGLSTIDAESSDVPVSLPPGLGATPQAVSVFLRGGPVAAARSLPIVGLRRVGRSPAVGLLSRRAPPLRG